MEFDQTFVTDFIEVYKSHPALWNIKSDQSKNKHLWTIGIEALKEYCKEKIPNADEVFVKRKINNLRTVFKKELNKVRQSKCTGSSTEDIYVPTLWYYDLLSFTTEDESGRVGISSIDDFTIEDDQLVNSISDHNSAMSSPIDHVPKKQNTFRTKKTEFLNLASEAIKSLNTPPDQESECTIIGKRFSLQLQSMTEDQRLLAEKNIGEVMYYGRREKLIENCFKYQYIDLSQSIRNYQIPSSNHQFNNQTLLSRPQIPQQPLLSQQLSSYPHYLVTHSHQQQLEHISEPKDKYHSTGDQDFTQL